MITKFNKAAVAAAVAASMLVVPQAAFAQATLVVDVDQIARESVAAKSGQAQIEAKYGARIKTVRASFDAALKGWNDQVTIAKPLIKPNTPLPPATEKALGDARQTLQEAQAQVEELQRELNSVSQYVQAQIVEKLIPIAERIRKDRKGDTVVPRNGLLAFEPANDITAVALQQLNATMTVVQIAPPEQPAAKPATPAATTPAKPQPQSR